MKFYIKIWFSFLKLLGWSTKCPETCIFYLFFFRFILLRFLNLQPCSASILNLHFLFHFCSKKWIQICEFIRMLNVKNNYRSNSELIKLFDDPLWKTKAFTKNWLKNTNTQKTGQITRPPMVDTKYTQGSKNKSISRSQSKFFSRTQTHHWPATWIS